MLKWFFLIAADQGPGSTEAEASHCVLGPNSKSTEHQDFNSLLEDSSLKYSSDEWTEEDVTLLAEGQRLRQSVVDFKHQAAWKVARPSDWLPHSLARLQDNPYPSQFGYVPELDFLQRLTPTVSCDLTFLHFISRMNSDSFQKVSAI